MLKTITIVGIFFLICLTYLFWIPPLLQLIIFLFCGCCVLVVSPLLYRIWIIPQIERRYGKKLTFHPVHQMDANPATNKTLDLAKYISCAYLGYRMKSSYYSTLDKYNYDIDTAPNIEIILSITTVFLFYIGCLLPLKGFVLILHDWLIRYV